MDRWSGTSHPTPESENGRSVNWVFVAPVLRAWRVREEHGDVALPFDGSPNVTPGSTPRHAGYALPSRKLDEVRVVRAVVVRGRPHHLSCRDLTTRPGRRTRREDLDHLDLPRVEHRHGAPHDTDTRSGIGKPESLAGGARRGHGQHLRADHRLVVDDEAAAAVVAEVLHGDDV